MKYFIRPQRIFLKKNSLFWYLVPICQIFQKSNVQTGLGLITRDPRLQGILRDTFYVTTETPREIPLSGLRQTRTCKTGPLERNSMSVCHQSKTDQDTFLVTYVSIDRLKAHFLGFLTVYESCMPVGSLGCYGPSKVTYQKVTID